LAKKRLLFARNRTRFALMAILSLSYRYMRRTGQSVSARAACVCKNLKGFEKTPAHNVPLPVRQLPSSVSWESGIFAGRAPRWTLLHLQLTMANNVSRERTQSGPIEIGAEKCVAHNGISPLTPAHLSKFEKCWRCKRAARETCGEIQPRRKEEIKVACWNGKTSSVPPYIVLLCAMSP